MLEALLQEWELRPDGDPRLSASGLLQPVRTRGGAAATLKVGNGVPGAELEHLALTRWDGDGAVRLLRADPHRRALLTERADDGSLADAWDVEACAVVAGLYPRLHRPAPAQFQRLSGAVVAPLTRLRELERGARLPRRLVEQAISLTGDFVRDEATDGTLVHTDLHYGTVLRADDRWLAVDPKPLSGDPHFEIAPMLWHRTEELAGDLRTGVRARFHALVDTAGLDEDRARDWVVVRAVFSAVDRIDDDAWVTTCISVIKAVQD